MSHPDNDKVGASGLEKEGRGLSRGDVLRRGAALSIGGVFAARGLPALAASGRTEQEQFGAAEGGTLRWLSWPGHNDKSFIGPFEKRYGVKVQGKEYSGGDAMLALAANSKPGTFDVVHSDAEYIAQLRQAGLLIPLDPAEFPETKQFWPEYSVEGTKTKFPGLWSGGKPYGFPMRFGLLSLAFNTKYVKPEDATSYKVLWSDKVKGKVGWFDWWSHMGPVSLYVGNKNPYNLSSARFKKMTDAVNSLKPATAGYYSIPQLFNVFANEEIYIQPAGGDWTALLLQQQGHPIATSVPKEGAIQWTECLGIFKGAKNPELAKEFIRYSLSAQGQVNTSILPAYQATIPSKAGWVLMNKEHPDVAKRLQMNLKGRNTLDLYRSGQVHIRQIPVQQTIKQWNEAWTRFKNL